MASRLDKCNDCDARAPAVNTGHTLIELGWRLLRKPMESGETLLEWRCPSCWAKYKEAHAMPPSSRGKH